MFENIIEMKPTTERSILCPGLNRLRLRRVVFDGDHWITARLSYGAVS